MSDPIETLGLIAARADIDAVWALTERDRLDCEARAIVYRRVQLELLSELPMPDPYPESRNSICGEALPILTITEQIGEETLNLRSAAWLKQPEIDYTLISKDYPKPSQIPPARFRHLATVLRGEFHGFLAGFLPHRFRKVSAMATSAKWYLMAEFSQIAVVRERGKLLPEQMEAIEILAMAERCAQFGAAVLRE